MLHIVIPPAMCSFFFLYENGFLSTRTVFPFYENRQLLHEHPSSLHAFSRPFGSKSDQRASVEKNSMSILK